MKDILKLDAVGLAKFCAALVVSTVVTNYVKKRLVSRDKRLRRVNELFDDLFESRGFENHRWCLCKLVGEVEPKDLINVAMKQHKERGNDDRVTVLLEALSVMGSRGEKQLKLLEKKLRDLGYNL